MCGVQTRGFVEMLLTLASVGGCTHFAATDGSKIGADASTDGRPHTACGVFEGMRRAGDGGGQPTAAYGCALAGDAEIADAEMAAVLLFLHRCLKAVSAQQEAVHAIIAIDSKSCFTEIETAWREESLLPLVGRNRAALLETIVILRWRIEAAGGSVRFVWVPAHVGIFSNQIVDAVAKAFLYDSPCEPELIVTRTIVMHEVLEGPLLRGGLSNGRSALLADRKYFRLLRRLTAQDEYAKLNQGQEEGQQVDGGDDDCNAAWDATSCTSWLGRWPQLDYERLGERRPQQSDAPRWTAIVKATSGGNGAGMGAATRPSEAGVRQTLRSGGRLLFNRATCPLCRWQPSDGVIDMRHVLCGECTEGATSEERSTIANKLREVLRTLPAARQERDKPGEHATALANEINTAAKVMEEGVRRDEAGAEAWWQASRTLSGLLPQMGRRTAASITEGISDLKKQKEAKAKVQGAVLGHLTEVAVTVSQIMARWLEAQWGADAATPAASRRSFAEERDEVIEEHLERGRGERAEKRATVSEARRRRQAVQVNSEGRPLRTRISLGPVAQERLMRPRWWKQIIREREKAAAEERRKRLQQRKFEELMERRERRVLEAAREAAMAEADRLMEEARACEQAREEARRESRLQAELAALMEEVQEATESRDDESETLQSSQSSTDSRPPKRKRKKSKPGRNSHRRLGHYERDAIANGARRVNLP